MKLPLQITFRNMEPSEALKSAVQEKADKLDQFCGDIMSCRVMVESQHRRHEKGNLYHVRIDLTVPGHELAVNQGNDLHHSYTDVYVAIRDAFDSARRQLEGLSRRRRQEVKAHETPPHGRISQLVTGEGYGRIQTPDGREIYFHRNSVRDADFAALKVGTEVRFNEEEGDRGPQASTVHVIGKHHIAG